MRGVLFGLVLAWLGVASCGGARAEDAPPADPAARLAALEAGVAKHAETADEPGLKEDVATARELAEVALEPAAKSRLVATVGRILDFTHDTQTERSAVKTLGVLADPAGFAYLNRFLASNRIEAIRAASRLRADETAWLLLDLAEYDRDEEVAIAAVEALAAFGHNKVAREAVLDRLVELVSKLRDRSVPENPDPFDPPVRRRREAFEVAGHRTLTLLTGTDIPIAEWQKRIAANKSDLDVLFSALPKAPDVPIERAWPELRAEVAAWERKTRAHLVTQDKVALRADLEALGATLARILDPGLRTRVAMTVGAIVEDVRDPAVQREAIRMIGEIGAPSAATFLEPFLSLVLPHEDERPILLDVIEAVVAMRATEALPRLFELVGKDRKPAVASMALRAILALVRERDARAKTLVDLADLVRKQKDDQPEAARPPPCEPWEGEYTRYQVLSRVLVEEFNRITGREVGGPETMFELIDGMRSEPTKLFVDASPEEKR